jgi:hypothetical protein
VNENAFFDRFSFTSKSTAVHDSVKSPISISYTRCYGNVPQESSKNPMIPWYWSSEPGNVQAIFDRRRFPLYTRHLDSFRSLEFGAWFFGASAKPRVPPFPPFPLASFRKSLQIRIRPHLKVWGVGVLLIFCRAVSRCLCGVVHWLGPAWWRRPTLFLRKCLISHILPHFF